MLFDKHISNNGNIKPVFCKTFSLYNKLNIYI